MLVHLFCKLFWFGKCSCDMWKISFFTTINKTTNLLSFLYSKSYGSDVKTTSMNLYSQLNLARPCDAHKFIWRWNTQWRFCFVCLISYWPSWLLLYILCSLRRFLYAFLKEWFLEAHFIYKLSFEVITDRIY